MCVDECVVLFYIFEAVLVLGFVLYCINVVGIVLLVDQSNCSFVKVAMVEVSCV